MKTRLTNTILIVMLLLNLAFIGSWWMMHKKGHNNDRMMHQGFHNMQDKGMMFLTRQLDFDTAQQSKAEKIFRGHAEKMQKYQSEISRMQREIFKSMASDAPDSLHAFMYADSVGTCRIALQKEMFRSSLAIRQICNADQKKKFDILMQNMGKRLGHQKDMHGDPTMHDSL